MSRLDSAARHVVVLMALSLLAACQSVGFVPETFNQRAAVAISMASTALESTEALLVADKITAADAENVVEQVTTLKAAIDVARAVYATDPAAGDERLTATLTGLRAVIAYLEAQQR